MVFRMLSRSRRALWRSSEIPRATTPSTSNRGAFGSPPVANGLYFGPGNPPRRTGRRAREDDVRRDDPGVILALGHREDRADARIGQPLARDVPVCMR